MDMDSLVLNILNLISPHFGFWLSKCFISKLFLCLLLFWSYHQTVLAAFIWQYFAIVSLMCEWVQEWKWDGIDNHCTLILWCKLEILHHALLTWQDFDDCCCYQYFWFCDNSFSSIEIINMLIVKQGWKTDITSGTYIAINFHNWPWLSVNHKTSL